MSGISSLVDVAMVTSGTQSLRESAFGETVRPLQVMGDNISTVIVQSVSHGEEASELSGQDLLKRVEQYHHRLDFALPAMRHALNPADRVSGYLRQNFASQADPLGLLPRIRVVAVPSTDRKRPCAFVFVDF
jgi:hypothetical protein